MTANNVVNYIHGLKLIVSDYGWYHYNAHGDVVQLSGNNGDVTRDYDYDPYGNIIQSTSGTDENPYRYCGEYYDTETGFTYLRARYYDPAIGRFISEDSALDGLNWYVYCGNDPVDACDPTGYYKVTRKQLKKLNWSKKARSSSNVKTLNKYLKKYKMNKKKIVRHFISQCMKESSFDQDGKKGELTSEACWLSTNAIKNYCAQYDFRKDLGNNKKGDGYKYRGVGYIQVTGKYNQTKFGDSIGDKNIKEQGTNYILKKNLLWAASTFWWNMNNMNVVVNKKGCTVSDVTKRVNGGINGLAEREKYYNQCKKVFK